jgi:hypothetical protein
MVRRDPAGDAGPVEGDPCLDRQQIVLGQMLFER